MRCTGEGTVGARGVWLGKPLNRVEVYLRLGFWDTKLLLGQLIPVLTLIAFALGFSQAVAVAAPLCAAAATNAAEFQALGNIGCQFGDKIFYDFTYSYTLQDSLGHVLTSNVPGTAVSIQFSNIGNQSYMPAVTFTANWDVIDGRQGDISISYSVWAPAPMAMYYSSMTLSGDVSNVNPLTQYPSYISGAEAVCCPGQARSVVPLGVELDAPLTPGGLVSATGSDYAYYSPATLITLSKDIFLSAGSDSGVPGGPPKGNEARLTRIDQELLELIPIPEPVSFLLFGGGLISIASLTKRLGKLNRNPRKP